MARPSRGLDNMDSRLTGSARRDGHCCRCLGWVMRVVLTMARPLPVYPDCRTSSEPVGMSQTGPGRVLSTQPGPLLDISLGQRPDCHKYIASGSFSSLAEPSVSLTSVKPCLS